MPRKEKSIRADVRRVLESRGYLVEINHEDQYGVPGRPDVYAHRGGRTIAIETKRPGEASTPIQVDYHHRLRSHGVPVLEAHSVQELVRWLDADTWGKSQHPGAPDHQALKQYSMETLEDIVLTIRDLLHDSESNIRGIALAADITPHALSRLLNRAPDAVNPTIRTLSNVFAALGRKLKITAE